MTGKKKQTKQAAAEPVEASHTEAAPVKAAKKGKGNQVNADAQAAAELAKAQQLAEEQAAAKAAAAAALAESQSWAVVVDPRKVKQQARLERKKAQLEEQKIEALPAGAPVPEVPKQPKKEKAEKKETVAVPSSTSHVSKLKKKAKAKPAAAKPKTAAELIAAITNILESAPTQFLQVSAIGDKIQTHLNCSWNTQYKPHFGTLNSFVASHAEAFHLTADGRVYTAKQHNALVDEKKEKEREIQQKKAASVARRAEVQKTPQKSTASRNAESKQSSPISLQLVFTLLGAGVLALVVLTQPRVKALLRL